MSWQCPTCETVNQDVTPICTVCDTLAPVIESFLSLEEIEIRREYNTKLDEVHRLEIEGDYEKMLQLALDAIAIYKENGLAVEKAKQALILNKDQQLKNELTLLLDSTIEKKNYLVASTIIRLIENFHLESPDIVSLKSEIKFQLDKEKEIDDILKESYKAIVIIQIDKALEIVDKGLEKYPSCKILQYRREEINSLKVLISEIHKKVEVKKKPFPKLLHRKNVIDPQTPTQPKDVISLDKRQKFPKPQRK